MEYREFTAKNVDDAITEACETLMVTSDRLDYEVISQGSAGFLGIASRPAIIKARIREEKPVEEVVEKPAVAVPEVKSPVKSEDNSDHKNEAGSYSKPEVKKENKKDSSGKQAKTYDHAAVSQDSSKGQPEAKETKKVSNVNGDELVTKANAFLKDVFGAMNMEVNLNTRFNADDNVLDVELSGDEMGVLIGKRGQTLDSLQYLISLVVNRDTEDYIHVKVDTENYRERRKATLENLAKNIGVKVKKTRQAVALEPMNPYERRIIHSALQNDRYVTTHSEGDEPFRRVVVTLKK
ncbi:MAG: protein jag [Butyrivibrio sp.]|nr:protein jag [Butyrivibrio sp.]